MLFALEVYLAHPINGEEFSHRRDAHGETWEAAADNLRAELSDDWLIAPKRQPPASWCHADTFWDL